MSAFVSLYSSGQFNLSAQSIKKQTFVLAQAIPGNIPECLQLVRKVSNRYSVGKIASTGTVS